MEISNKQIVHEIDNKQLFLLLTSFHASKKYRIAPNFPVMKRELTDDSGSSKYRAMFLKTIEHYGNQRKTCEIADTSKNCTANSSNVKRNNQFSITLLTTFITYLTTVLQTYPFPCLISHSSDLLLCLIFMPNGIILIETRMRANE